MKDSQKDHALPSNSEIRDYFNILKEDPSSRVFAPLAEALIRRGRLDEAEKICQMGLEANPEFSDGHLAYARVLYYLFRYQEALKQVKVTLASTPGSVEAYLIAAEIFLARSQHKSASEACLKAIDLDPENIEARQILRRINVQAEEQKAGKVAVRPQRGPTSKFRATAGTAPSRRLQESNSHPTPADPFRQLLQETGSEGAGRLDRMEQPFSALSPGSYPADDREFGEASSDDLSPDRVPTERLLDKIEEQEAQGVMGLKKHRHDGTPVPNLPEHPTQPEDLLSEVPDNTDPKATESPAWVPPGSPASHPPPPDLLPDKAPEDSELPSVENIQALIDSYALRSQSEAYDSIPVKMPRSGRLLVVLFVLVSIGAMIGLILLGFGDDRKETRTGSAPATASTAPIGEPDKPIPLPDDVEKPEPDAKVPEPEIEEPSKGVQEEPLPEDTETAKKAPVVKKVKPRRKKKTRRRRKKRKRRKKRRTRRKRKSR